MLRPCHTVQFFLKLATQFYPWEIYDWQIHVSITVCQYILNISNIHHEFTSLKSETASQVARKIALCDRALTGRGLMLLMPQSCSELQDFVGNFQFQIHTLRYNSLT